MFERVVAESGVTGRRRCSLQRCAVQRLRQPLGTLGFDPDQFAERKTVPGRTTLGRAWRNRVPVRLKTFIQTSGGVSCRRDGTEVLELTPLVIVSRSSGDWAFSVRRGPDEGQYQNWRLVLAENERIEELE
jgi:hypothetical protein